VAALEYADVRKASLAVAVAATLYVMSLALRAGGQLPDTFFDERSAPAIAYATQQPNDPVARLNERLATGSATLAYEPGSGYLRAVLNALAIPVESQLATFAKSSVQAPIISPANPRTLFFNDNVVVGWPRGGFIEAASIDPQLGVEFYILDQNESAAPRFARGRGCATCHDSLEALAVPGLLLRSHAVLANGQTLRQLGSEVVDHRLPFGKRWGGWYVTGRSVGVASLGNVMLNPPLDMDAGVEPRTIPLTTLRGTFDTDVYLSPYSDVAALMVFDHQVHMTNLLARMSWEARAAEGRPDAAMLVDAVAREVVDYMLFIDEAPLTARLEGSSGFAEWFSARGPADARGRSLRQLDLNQRLLRYPCSYMIYSDAFDGLPPIAHEAIYRRMHTVLSGEDQTPRYARLNAADRRAIIEILRDTRTGLPDYFR
jgi:hypothetical protein